MVNDQQVILVDENDNPLGSIGKLDAHRQGLKHRAFSVFIFNAKGQLLLQRRALNKYHSPGLWSNACCSHPLPDEQTQLAAQRRLKEELGFTTALTKAFDFSYKVSFTNGLFENEFDHVYIGEYNGKISPNPDEVSDYSFRSVQEIRAALESEPASFTEWFRIAFPKIELWLEENKIQ